MDLEPNSKPAPNSNDVRLDAKKLNENPHFTGDLHPLICLLGECFAQIATLYLKMKSDCSRSYNGPRAYREASSQLQ